MADKTKISWADASWNPVTGCSRVSPGCENCYAEALSLRMGWSTKPWKAQNAAENVILHPERLEQPLHWTKPRRIFVNSMSDLFHELIPLEFLDRVFSVMEHCPQHTFQILTKRPARMLGYVTDRWIQKLSWLGPETAPDPWIGHGYLPGNIWLGTSVEDQRRAHERIPPLLATPAAVRFLSCEPLLETLDLSQWLGIYRPVEAKGNPDIPWSKSVARSVNRLSWLIDGGESGPHYRPDNQDWYRSLRDQCVAADVAYFHKQSAGLRPAGGVELDGQIWHQFPDTMRQELAT